MSPAPRAILDDPPTLEQVAAVLDSASPQSGAHMRRAADARVEILGHGDEILAEGWATRWRVEVLAVVVRWTQPSFRGPREVAETILQVLEGGLVDGEGSAYARQYHLEGETSAEEAATMLRMIVAGRLPRLIAGGEL